MGSRRTDTEEGTPYQYNNATYQPISYYCNLTIPQLPPIFLHFSPLTVGFGFPKWVVKLLVYVAGMGGESGYWFGHRFNLRNADQSGYSPASLRIQMHWGESFRLKAGWMGGGFDSGKSFLISRVTCYIHVIHWTHLTSSDQQSKRSQARRISFHDFHFICIFNLFLGIRHKSKITYTQYCSLSFHT